MARKSNLKSPRLSELEKRGRRLRLMIAVEKKQIRDRSKVRKAIRARVLGESLERMQQRGLLDESFLNEMKNDLMEAVVGKNAEFESLQGTVFDLTAPLHENSIEILSLPDSGDPAEDPMSGRAADTDIQRMEE